MLAGPLSTPRIPPSFWAYLASRLCSATAMTLLRSAIAWHVFDLSGSAFHLGLVGLVNFVPALGLTLLGGAVADAYDRRRITRLAQLPMMASVGALAFASEAGGASLPLLYAVSFAVACAGAFDSPARQALLPTLVPLEVFPRAVTFSSTVQALAFATGPALGGVAIAAGGVELAYGVYAVLVAANVIGLGFVRAVREVGERRAPSWRSVREGLGFVRRSPLLWGCMALDMFAVIFGGATALLPIYASEILAVGPRGYGVLSASLEVGALSAAVVMMLRRPIARAGPALLAAVAVYGIATIAFGVSRSFPLSLVAYAIAGMADQVSVVMRHTTIQLATPDALRGRVSAVNMIAISASNQLGAVRAGFVAEATSPTFSVVSGAIGCLAVLVLVAWRVPELRRHRQGAA